MFFIYAKIFSKLRRICKSRYFTLPRRYRYDRRALLLSGVGQRKEKHDKRKKALGRKVLVIDPVPALPIGHSGKSIVWFLLGAENPYERRNRNTIRYLRRRGWISALLLHVGCRNINIRGQIVKDFDHGTGEHSDFFV